MNFAAVIEFSAATLGLCSGFLFCIGVLNLKDETLKTIAESMWGSKPTLAKELALQKVDFIFGAILLGLSFFVQVAGKFLSSTAVPSGAVASLLCEALVGVGVPVVLVALLWVPRSYLRRAAIKRLQLPPEGVTAQ